MATATAFEPKLEHDGFVVVHDALSPVQVQRLRNAFDAGLATVPPLVPTNWDATKYADEYAGAVQPVVGPVGEAGAGPHGIASRRYPNILAWDPAFVSLADNPAVQPLLAAALGPDFVLNHDYGHALQPHHTRDGMAPPHAVVRGQLHNVAAVSPQNRLARNRLWGGTSNLMTVVYDLEDAEPADGGFGCVAGSHRKGYKLPIPKEPDPLTGEYPPLVKRVPCKAGTCIVFTELCFHCTLPWNGNGKRKTVFLKFSPADDPFTQRRKDWAARYQALDNSLLGSRLRAILGLTPLPSTAPQRTGAKASL